MTKAPVSDTTPKNNRGDDAVWEERPEIVTPILKIDERPSSWWECILYGWQHTLVDISPFVLPLLVATAAGLSELDGAIWVNRGLFTMGIATLIMTTFGNRLPIIQGPSATLTGALSSVVSLYGMSAMWGGILVGALMEMVVGLSGILRVLRKVFPVAVSGVVVITIEFAPGDTGL